MTKCVQRLAQKELARVMTAWIHGAAAIAGIESSSAEMFSGDLTKLSDAQLADMAGTIPTTSRAPSSRPGSRSSISSSGSASRPRGKARATIEQGGLSINNVAVKDVAKKVTVGDLMTETRLILRKGKKTCRIVRAI